MMPGKPVAARGKRFSPAELEAARRTRLADVIADDLVVLFCGANPGLSSAAACQVHHVKHKANGGPTSVKECVLLCFITTRR